MQERRCCVWPAAGAERMRGALLFHCTAPGEYKRRWRIGRLVPARSVSGEQQWGCTIPNTSDVVASEASPTLTLRNQNQAMSFFKRLFGGSILSDATTAAAGLTRRFCELFLVCFCLLLANSAAMADENAHVDTRHGRIAAVSHLETTEIRYQGKVLLALEADSASLHRITSANTEHEFVIVSAWHPGLNCHYFFHLLDISANSTAVVSKDFGECLELTGAGFSDGHPVVHLRAPVIPGRPFAATSFIWKNGEISEVFASSDQCAAIDFAAKTNAKKVSSADLGRQVAGPARLQFFAAPSGACAKKGTFVVAGDSLTASLEYDGFVFVVYTNPKTGNRVAGWVSGGRLILKEK